MHPLTLRLIVMIRNYDTWSKAIVHEALASWNAHFLPNLKSSLNIIELFDVCHDVLQGTRSINTLSQAPHAVPSGNGDNPRWTIIWGSLQSKTCADRNPYRGNKCKT